MEQIDFRSGEMDLPKLLNTLINESGLYSKSLYDAWSKITSYTLSSDGHQLTINFESCMAKHEIHALIKACRDRIKDFDSSGGLGVYSMYILFKGHRNLESMTKAELIELIVSQDRLIEEMKVNPFKNNACDM